jgi:hypothetical protein
VLALDLEVRLKVEGVMVLVEARFVGGLAGLSPAFVVAPNPLLFEEAFDGNDEGGVASTPLGLLLAAFGFTLSSCGETRPRATEEDTGGV